MQSGASIIYESELQGRKARRYGRVPLSIRNYSEIKKFCKQLPNLGDYVPEGWEVCEGIEPILVDCGGQEPYGSEPALGLIGLKAVLDGYKKSGDHYGFGICEVGEFQLCIRVFRPDHRDFTHTGLLKNSELNRLGTKRGAK